MVTKMNNDWNGNRKSIFVTLGASNHCDGERETHDYYATEPKALLELLKYENFSTDVWECACGEGHLSKVLCDYGYNVKSTDLIQREYGQGNIDFLQCAETFDGDIITNPPYKYAQEFVEHALSLIPDGRRVVMLLKLTFLEGKARQQLFLQNPPKTIYVFSGRVKCAKNGDFNSIGSSAVAYAWFIWEKGFKGEPIIKWLN